jgi:hypothetical protein
MYFNAVIKSMLKTIGATTITGIASSNNVNSTVTDSHRTVTIYNINSADMSSTKKLQEIPYPTTKQNWASDKAAIKILDLKFITPVFDIRGVLSGDRDGNVLRTTLSGSMTNVQTTVPLTDVTLVENASETKPSFLDIDGELIKYTGKSAASGAANLTGCIRGIFGTAAVTHSSGARVYHPAWHYAEMLRYILEAGGVFNLLWPSYSSIEQTIGDASLSSTLGILRTVNVRTYKISHVPSDGNFDNIPVSITVVEGEDI